MKKSLVFSLLLIIKIGIVTAIPLITFSNIGRFLDQRLSSRPYFFIVGCVIAGMITYFLLRWLIKIATKQFIKLSN